MTTWNSRIKTNSTPLLVVLRVGALSAEHSPTSCMSLRTLRLLRLLNAVGLYPTSSSYFTSQIHASRRWSRYIHGQYAHRTTSRERSIKSESSIRTTDLSRYFIFCILSDISNSHSNDCRISHNNAKRNGNPTVRRASNEKRQPYLVENWNRNKDGSVFQNA